MKAAGPRGPAAFFLRARYCRGVLTENDWRRTDVQERYRGHFHPLVQALIDAGESTMHTV